MATTIARASLGTITAALVAAATLGAGIGPSTVASVAHNRTIDPDNGSCPVGYLLADRAELIAERALPTLRPEGGARNAATMVDPTCVIADFPEAPAEKLQRASADLASFLSGQQDAPAGIVYTALKQAARLANPQAAARVEGTDGAWEPYGNGNLIGDDPFFTETAGQGLTDLAGRIDSFDYDPERQVVYATGGTSGVWISDDLADSWTSIGDNLPSLANGSLAWTPAGGDIGTLVVNTGEPLFGGIAYGAGTGVWWTSDEGASWHRADGVPNDAMGFAVEVDRNRPDVVYAATSFGLFRSDDAARTFTNVELPTSAECQGVTGYGNPCDTANVVTDVIVKIPGGSTEDSGGQVLAAVGFRNDQKTYSMSGETRSPGQGLYFSDTGDVGSFTKVDPLATGVTNVGFVEAARQGRVEFGQASGPDQDHNYVYAIVQDALKMAGGTPFIDVPEGIDQVVGNPISDAQGILTEDTIGARVVPNTNLNGLYASPDFGQTWLRMADSEEIAGNPATGSALAPIRALNPPGIQAWYNLWIEPDPTRTDPGTSAPARLLFGLEEVWAGRTQIGIPYDGAAQAGPNDFIVVGRYFGGDRCAFLDNPVPLPACPLANPVTTDYTTHPDQHDALWIPSGDGGVVLLVGNDGGVYKQVLGPLDDVDNAKWQVSNVGMNTLLPYSVSVSEDGTVWFGLQDNGTAKIEPERDDQLFMAWVGDGTYATVDPYDGGIAMASTPGGAFSYTTNGGASFSSASGAMGDGTQLGREAFQFITPWKMDPDDSFHYLTAGTKVYESLSMPSNSWKPVFDLGSPAEQPNVVNLGSAMGTRGDANYIGYCGVCDPYRNPGTLFMSGIATNVGGDEPGQAETPLGWHHATGEGLPNRYITDLWVDANDEETVYATLGGYAGRRWAGIGTWTDTQRDTSNEGGNVYKSTDAGETWVDISSGLPDIRANWVIQRDGQLIVANDVGVFMSSDLDGSDWAQLTGLPNAPVKQVMLRPDHPDELFAAVYGRSIYRFTFGAPADAGTGDVLDDQVSAGPTTAPAPPVPSATPLPTTGGGLALAAVLALAGATASRRRR